MEMPCQICYSFRARKRQVVVVALGHKLEAFEEQLLEAFAEAAEHWTQRYSGHAAMIRSGDPAAIKKARDAAKKGRSRHFSVAARLKSGAVVPLLSRDRCHVAWAMHDRHGGLGRSTFCSTSSSILGLSRQKALQKMSSAVGLPGLDRLVKPTSPRQDGNGGEQGGEASWKLLQLD
eukprot:Skav215603  [mRNA]  locus=scaffold666:445213:447277:- [translate_table: standard]